MSKAKPQSAEKTRDVTSAEPLKKVGAASSPRERIATLSDREILYVLGEVCWLMTRSPKHRHVFMADLDWLVLPALLLKQARVFRGRPQTSAPIPSGQQESSGPTGNPLVYTSWALVSDEVDARLKSGVARLQPSEWRSGPHPWVIDVLAPFGGGDQAIEVLVKEIFGGKPVPVLPFGGKLVPVAGSFGSPQT